MTRLFDGRLTIVNGLVRRVHIAMSLVRVLRSRATASERAMVRAIRRALLRTSCREESGTVALNHFTVDFLIFITFSFALDNSTCYMRALRMKHIFNSDLKVKEMTMKTI